MEFMQLPMVQEETLDVPSLQEINMVISPIEAVREKLRKWGKRGKWGNNHNPMSSLPRNDHPNEPPENSLQASVREQPEVVFFSTHGTCGILDTGASKSVIGSKLLPALIESLTPHVRQQVFRTSCDITFRFGNQGTLDSQHALVVPLKSIGLGLKIAIVPGETPLLLSNTLMRTLKASLDSEHHTLSSPLLKHSVKLKLSPRGLYMLDLNDLLSAQKDLYKSVDAPMAETFLSSDFSSENQPNEPLQPVMPDGPTKLGSHMIAPTGPGPQVQVHVSSRSQGYESQCECTEISRPKPLPSQFLELVAQVSPSYQHESVKPDGTCDGSDPSRKHRRVPSTGSGNDEPAAHHFRTHTCGQDICRDVGPGEAMDEMVFQNVCRQHQDRTHEATSIHGESPRPIREDPQHGATDEPRRSAGSHPAQRQVHAEKPSNACSPDSSGRGRSRDRPTRTMGRDGCLINQSCASSRDDRCSAGSCTEHGRSAERDPRTSPTGELDGALQMLRKAGDIDADFEISQEAVAHFHSTSPNHLHRKCHQLVQQFSKELASISQSCHQRSAPIQVLEVFCGPQSELTKQVNNLGFKACRHGLSEGDLGTVEGRSVLFTKLIQGQPRSLWYSPTCGPWCAWSAMNAAQTEAGFKTIQNQREQHVFQLALGIVLFRFQQSHGRHMHWEQPARSVMTRSPMLKEVAENTYLAQFDMCRVGMMRDPVNQLLYKKGMEIMTTSYQLYSQLHGRKCNHQHQHQTLEGHTTVKGHSIRRTEFSENYTRKFARTLAHVLTKLRTIKEAPWHSAEYDFSFASAGVKRSPASASASNAKRAKLKTGSLKSALINPEVLPSKRRRLSEKSQDERSPKALCELTCSKVLERMPRVGRKEIDDPQIKSMLQEIFGDKQIQRVIACKGTERTLVPPRDLMRGEAPFRRAIIMQRNTRNIQVEDQWEEWEDLSHRQQWRRSHPSYLNITVFACNPSTEATSAAEREVLETEPAEQNQSPIPDGSPVDAPMPELHPPTATAEIEAPETVPGIIEPSQVDFSSKDHGPRFLLMSPENKKLALRLHKNLGHPDPNKLSQILKQRGYDAELSQGVLDLKCSVRQMTQKPKLQRPATLKEALEFGDKVSVDGVKWTSQHGHEYHFYHFIDHGTNYHSAIIGPNRAEIQDRFTLGWLSWAGTPNEVILDSASEFVSQSFSSFLQNLGVKVTVVPPNAHWQMGRIERHGGILQEMLSKYELEHEITNYSQLQQALAQCTMAKNTCGIRQGYSPEMLVFGKSTRIPGSLSGDDELPSHAKACEESTEGLRFREQLARRETARRAFHSADNSMAIRRAALRRERPYRGAYEIGEWVMVWRIVSNQGSWVGPAKVIQQDGTSTVFCNNMGSILKAAPEHVRPVSAVEARLIPLDQVTTEAQRTQAQPNTRPQNTSNAMPESHSSTINPMIIDNPNTSNPHGSNPNVNYHNPQHTSSQSSSDQPDQEPDNQETPRESETAQNPNEVDDREPYEIPIPDDSVDELVCDLLTCHDMDNEIGPDGHELFWKTELEISQEQLEKTMSVQKQNREEAFLFLATNAKKQHTEVKLSTLDPAERLEFEAAKTKEVTNWLQTGTVVRILRNQLSPKQILRCRWLYVWKPLEDPKDIKENNGKSRKAKARLVVLGYMDPQLDTIPRDSPTLGRTSKMLIAQVIASMQWTLMSFDIKAAFLQGKTQEDRVIAIEPVPEMVKAMNLQSDEVCKLVKSAYGLIDAPFLWYTELDRQLKALGFIPSPFDPCLYLLHEEGKTEPAGILGVHVDDGLCGGNEVFHAKIKELETKFPFGSRKTQSFVFTGIEMNQQGDHSMIMSQEKYISKINPIHIQPQRKTQEELPVTERERQDLRALIGSLQYAAVNTRPDLSSRLSFLQSEVNKATIDTLIQGNRILHDAKKYKDTYIRIQPIPMESIRFLAFSDASFASKKQPESHTGTIIMTTHADIGKNHVCPVNPISWGCKKIQRVVTSTLSAETTSLSTTLDQLSWLRLFWSWIRDPNTDWKNATATLNKLPETYATTTFKEDESIAVTDCKSLFDLVTRTAPPSCQEFRTQLQARAIKDLLAEGVKLRWVHTGAQLADALTKIMQCHFLRNTLRCGRYSLHDEEEILKERASSRTRTKWLQTTTTTDEPEPLDQ